MCVYVYVYVYVCVYIPYIQHKETLVQTENYAGASPLPARPGRNWVVSLKSAPVLHLARPYAKGATNDKIERRELK